jgi:hypothetical protein
MKAPFWHGGLRKDKGECPIKSSCDRSPGIAAGWPKADSEVMNQYIQYMTQVTRFDESPVCVASLLVGIIKTDSERA